MKRIRILIAALLLTALLTGGCGRKKITDGGGAYERVKASAYIKAEEAFEALSDPPAEGAEAEALRDLLGRLIACSGAFVQEQPEDGNPGRAAISFYLNRGEAYCEVSCDGFAGSVEDGAVTPTKEKGYQFESSPNGRLAGQDVSFRLLFAEDALWITWSGAPEYTLVRAKEGSGDAAEAVESVFEGSEAYQKALEAVDGAFGDFGRAAAFDAGSGAFFVYVQAPEGTRADLEAGKRTVFERWSGFVQKAQAFSADLRTQLGDVKAVKTVSVIAVDLLNARNEYGQNGRLLLAKNGALEYNYADEVDPPEEETASEPETTREADTTRASGAPSTRPSGEGTTARAETTTAPRSSSVTAGERRALQTALFYLDAMPYSYSGLIDQLKYEGYSESEARYAADNCGADWYEQAVRCAESYLDTMPFSRSELIGQLEYEGFTGEQARYAVSQVY